MDEKSSSIFAGVQQPLPRAKFNMSIELLQVFQTHKNSSRSNSSRAETILN